MKKILLFASMFLFVSVISLKGQIQNGNFEMWNSTSYSEPDGWSTGNSSSIEALGVAPVTIATGLTGNAVRLETMVINGDTSEAYITNGDPMSGEGGVPCAHKPSGVKLTYRYQTQGNDSAIFLLVFKSQGYVIDNYIFKIAGTQNTFITNIFTLSLPFTPDSVVIAAASSNLIENIGVTDGSFLEIDEVIFTNAGGNPLNVIIPNSSFSNWSQNSYDQAALWQSYGDVVKTNDSQEGNFAIQLTTVDYGNGNIGSAGITNGMFSNNGPSTGGIAFTSMSDTITGYYKYISAATDTATMHVMMKNNGTPVGGGGFDFLPVSSFTYFEIPVSSMSQPDTLLMDFSSSRWPYTQSSAGSSLIIDNLKFKSETTLGIKNPTDLLSTVYPNPANDVMHIRLPGISSGNLFISIYDVAGKAVMKEKFTNAGVEIRLNISALTTGVYFYTIDSGTKTISNTFWKK
jgi:hypothetical protein